MSRAWEKEFNLAKARQKYRPGNYFQTYEWSPNYSIKAKCERIFSSAYYTLKLGHGYLKTYLKRIGKANSNLCRCGGSVETAQHLLLSCPEYSSTRPARLRGDPPLGLVFKSKEDRAVVLEFIRRTGIVTRRWHLARAEEEVEEGGETT